MWTGFWTVLLSPIGMSRSTRVTYDNSINNPQFTCALHSQLLALGFHLVAMVGECVRRWLRLESNCQWVYKIWRLDHLAAQPSSLSCTELQGKHRHGPHTRPRQWDLRLALSCVYAQVLESVCLFIGQAPTQLTCTRFDRPHRSSGFRSFSQEEHLLNIVKQSVEICNIILEQFGVFNAEVDDSYQNIEFLEENVDSILQSLEDLRQVMRPTVSFLSIFATERWLSSANAWSYVCDLSVLLPSTSL